MKSEYKLSDLIEIKYGKDHKKLDEGSVPVYGSGGIMRYVDKYLYDKESILIPRKGTLNNIFYVKEKFWTVDTIFWSKINIEKVNGKFLYYYLTTLDFSSMNVGSAVPSMTASILNDIIIKIPPIPTQKKIAHILSTLDDKIELNRKMNQTLEEMAQALFKSWFVDFDPVHAKAGCKSDDELEAAAKEIGISKEVLELFPSEFMESEMGMIPLEWEVKRFGDVVEKYIDNRGKTPPTVESGIPLLEVRNMPDDILTAYPNVTKFVSEEIYESWFRAHLKENDILISTVGTIGKTCIMPSNTRIAIAQNVLGLRFKSNILDNQFMFYQMKSRRFLHAIDARLVITVQASIKRKDLNTIDIIVPPSEIQDLFVNQIQPILKKQQGNENYTLMETRDTLLPKLLSGELNVSEIEV